MIEIKTLTESDKQREVIYTTHGGHEFGRITSWNDRFIFVRYHLKVFDDGIPVARTGITSEATRPEDLEWSS